MSADSTLKNNFNNTSFSSNKRKKITILWSSLMTTNTSLRVSSISTSHRLSKLRSHNLVPTQRLTSQLTILLSTSRLEGTLHKRWIPWKLLWRNQELKRQREVVDLQSSNTTTRQSRLSRRSTTSGLKHQMNFLLLTNMDSRSPRRCKRVAPTSSMIQIEWEWTAQPEAELLCSKMEASKSISNIHQARLLNTKLLQASREITLNKSSKKKQIKFKMSLKSSLKTCKPEEPLKRTTFTKFATTGWDLGQLTKSTSLQPKDWSSKKNRLWSPNSCWRTTTLTEASTRSLTAPALVRATISNHMEVKSTTQWPRETLRFSTTTCSTRTSLRPRCKKTRRKSGSNTSLSRGPEPLGLPTGRGRCLTSFSKRSPRDPSWGCSTESGQGLAAWLKTKSASNSNKIFSMLSSQTLLTATSKRWWEMERLSFKTNMEDQFFRNRFHLLHNTTWRTREGHHIDTDLKMCTWRPNYSTKMLSWSLTTRPWNKWRTKLLTL